MDVTALHKLSYGVYIVASKMNGRLNGQIANAVIQVTSEPITIAASINKQNLTWEFIKKSGVFSVSILCEDTPLEFIGRFGFHSGRDMDKFEGIKYKLGETGAPIVLDNAVACLEARVKQAVDAGSHTIFIGEVVNAEMVSNEVCMTYEHYHEIKGGKTPQAAATYIKETPPKTRKEQKTTMTKYVCTICGYVYEPEKGAPDNGVNPGTPFEKIPDDWTCPVCGAAKSEFEKGD